MMRSAGLYVQLPGGEGHAVLQQPVLLLISRPESHGEHFLNADVDVPGPADFYVCIGNVGMRHHLFCDLVPDPARRYSSCRYSEAAKSSSCER